MEPRPPVTVGENARLMPDPATPEAALDANAELVPVPVLWPGPLRALPCKPVAAWAMDWPDAAAMFRPASARAPLLITPEVDAAPAPETDGEKDPLVPEPVTDDAKLIACADPAPWPETWPGPFRAVPREPLAAWAMD